MGSAPNAAATADVSHPAKQGLGQSLGVFMDTLVCSATAFMILFSGIYESTEADGIMLTRQALESYIGGWAVGFISFAVFMFAFSSIIVRLQLHHRQILRRDEHPVHYRLRSLDLLPDRRHRPGTVRLAPHLRRAARRRDCPRQPTPLVPDGRDRAPREGSRGRRRGEIRLRYVLRARPQTAPRGGQVGAGARRALPAGARPGSRGDAAGGGTGAVSVSNRVGLRIRRDYPWDSEPLCINLYVEKTRGGRPGGRDSASSASGRRCPTPSGRGTA